ncbi:MAG: hypothetical protein KBT19_02715 [Lachnospiraceae bacterium]|nr:hypothetical protein [Candidatus Colinaster equi]
MAENKTLSRDEMVNALYESFTGRKVNEREDTYIGRYDPDTGTYYCGVDAQIDHNRLEDIKRYIASRYYDYMYVRTDKNGASYPKEVLEANQIKGEALKNLMDKFNIPISNFNAYKDK